MTLKEQLDELIDSLNASRVDIRNVILSKGVICNDFTIKEIADLIRRIQYSEFEFFMRFDDIDQFGTPRTLLSGRPIGDFYLFNPTFDYKEPIDTLFDLTKPLLVDGNLVSGVWGVYTGLTQPMSSDMQLNTDLPYIEYNENILPEELHYVDTDNNNNVL